LCTMRREGKYRLKRRRVRGKLLIDTKPLTVLLRECMGLQEPRLSKAITLLGLEAASVWPVFTETLYFLGKELKSRHDRQQLVQKLKGCLKGVKEEYIPFHKAAQNLAEDLEIADTTLLQAAESRAAEGQPVTIVTEDSRLAAKASREGLTALTAWQLLQLTGQL
jgi:hypothetical protein